MTTSSVLGSYHRGNATIELYAYLCEPGARAFASLDEPRGSGEYPVSHGAPPARKLCDTARMRMINLRILASLAFLTLFASGAALTGCGSPSISTICQDQCVCQKCTDAEFQKCVTEGEKIQKQVEQLGCSNAFDDSLSCFHDNMSCTTTPDKICEPEDTAVNACLSKNKK